MRRDKQLRYLGCTLIHAATVTGLGFWRALNHGEANPGFYVFLLRNFFIQREALNTECRLQWPHGFKTQVGHGRVQKYDHEH